MNPPKIIDPYNGEWTGWHPLDTKGYTGRRPFIYYDPSHTVYMGMPGEHHGSIVLRHDLPPGGEGQHEGYVMKGLPDFPDEVSFYRNEPQNPGAILNAVSNHTGVPISNPLDDEYWRFAAADKYEDPIAYEREHDWDRQGDVGRHPDIEWVPTTELRKFIEYDRRPGKKDSWYPDRYNALAKHIKQNGFKNPVQLEFNQDSGTAHMGEGNHRTWIALEAGIPSMPVRVNRSRRQSPTQVRVHLNPQPEWESQYDPSGYHVPSSLKPSHIGLPVVPAPDKEIHDWPLT